MTHSNAFLEKYKTSEIVSRKGVFRERWDVGRLWGSAGAYRWTRGRGQLITW